MKEFVVWWMKRDLRLADNAALNAAALHAQRHNCPLVALWISEPEAFEAPEFHARRERFVLESLIELESRLQPLNIQVIIADGEATSVFESLANKGMRALFSHEETGVLWTFNRDKQLKRLLRARSIAWSELPTNGVVRGLKDRSLWQRELQRRMKSAPVQSPQQHHLNGGELASVLSIEIAGAVRFYPWHLRAESKLVRAAQHAPRQQQRGGESVGLALLRRFLAPEVHRKYIRNLSRPHEAQYFSSRLSPYLAFGCLSSRQILTEIQQFPSESLDARSLSAFKSRLAWRCHFMQKLENFPEMEIREQNAALARLRPEMSDDEFGRWTQGLTGFPLVDACLRSVHHTGFLNFRMRAMLMSFATHLMWRDWRAPSWDLARAFLDFEPGIHFAQVQMQAAVTGNNQIRIYNPLKQSEENDSECRFIKHWVPELKEVPCERIHACLDLPSGYPKPIVDLRAAMSHARENLFARFREPDVRAEARVVQDKLGSRGGYLSWRGRKALRAGQAPRRKKKTNSEQGDQPTLFDEIED
ncbi:MAG: deoxyribodipyrimidine photolyase [Betaproteobacteria bacterium]|nr:deoxyribodipyrimidine photolyase [Betaproteobacteria bacterium]